MTGASPPERGPAPGRVLALDIGSVRIGVAITDPGRIIAQGLDVWSVDGKGGGWRQRFEEHLERYDPTLILIGMPRRTDGSMGPEGQRIADLVEDLRASYPEREFAIWDERFTTVIAQQALLEADVSRRGRRQRVDQVAAALILQNWLEGQRG